MALLDYIKRFSKETGIQVDLVYKARKQGSFEDVFNLVISNPFVQTGAVLIGKDMASALIKKFISPNPKKKLSTEESTKITVENYVNLKEKYNNGILTKSEVDMFLNSDSKLAKHKSIFWESLQLDEQVSQAEINQNNNVLQLVSRSEFESRIIAEEQKSEIIHNAKVFITSPVLIKESKEMWSGEYKDRLIKFYVHDNDFKQKVFNGEISFKGATVFIDCELKKIRQFEDNSEAKPKYQVEVVNGWGMILIMLYSYNILR